jgi:DNA-binding SARP family transcriptional activator/tetratricopeptide (TPR) repeat protein
MPLAATYTGVGGGRWSGERKDREAVVLRVGVLGPVIAQDGDRELSVGQPRQQAVLGVLAMRANRVISRSELIDAVWGTDAPPSAEGGVYTYVAGLRRIFEPGRSLRGPGRILVSTGVGYVLHLIPGQPDAVTFEQHLGQARLLRKNGDVPGAVAALDAGLGMWRGVQAFAGVPGPFADTERTRLGELKSAANEERADALLVLNRHEEVLADLTVMVADHPLRERMRGLLMISMYRSGRQAEALKVFSEGRRVLAEELGIDPGTELSRIHQRVLTSDPALDAKPPATAADLASPADPGTAATVPAVAAAGPGQSSAAAAGPGQSSTAADDSPPVPAQLPSDAPGFSGRHEELGILNGMLSRRGSVPIVAISGTAGVGKTALAVRFGRQVARRFPDGQLYLNLRGFDPALEPVMPSDALRFILVSLGVPPSRVPTDPEGRAALYRSMADGKRMLIVLDNATGAAQVRPLLPGSPSCLVVVTSRNEMNGLVAADGAVPVNLDVLDRDEARELLDLRLGRDRIEGDPQSADEIIAACARLPLALSIAVGRAVGRPKRPLAELAGELRQAMSGLDALEDDDDVATDVRAVFSWSYDQLSVKAARMFRLLGLHPGPDISLSAAASLAGLPRQDAASALRELVRTSMVTERTHARYGFHDLLRAYAAEQAERFDAGRDRRQAAQRMLDHYLHAAMGASHRFNPTTMPLPLKPPLPGVALVDVSDKNQAVSWFDAEFPTLLTVIGYAAANGFDEYAWQLPYTLLAYCLRRGRWQEEEAIQRIALNAARRLGDPSALAHAHLQLGHAQAQLMDYEAAEQNFRESLAGFRDLGDRAGEAIALGGLGTMFDNQRQHAAALNEFLVMLRIVKALGHWWTQGSAENCVGWQYAMLGRYEEALEHCRRALALVRESGNAGVMADTLDSLGMIHYRLGDHVAAKDYYARAIDLHQELGASFGEAQSRQALGDVLADEGDEPGARKAYEEALAALGALRHPLAEEVRAKLTALDSRAPHLLHT